MSVKITEYGYGDDPYGDTLTRQGWGGWGNRLNGASCALTDSEVKALGLTPRDHGAKLKITFSNGTVIYRFWADRAPESNQRLDLYEPEGFDKSIPDEATVEVVQDIGSTPANPL